MMLLAGPEVVEQRIDEEASLDGRQAGRPRGRAPRRSASRPRPRSGGSSATAE